MMSWSSQHAETILGVLLGLLLSIPVGFYLSLYGGLVVARWARFEELRYELIRILQCIEWPPGTKGFLLLGGHRTYDITLISADLFALGHAKAGNIAAHIESEVSKGLSQYSAFLTSEQKDKQFTEWMRKARTMRPSTLPILDPRPTLYRRIRYRPETQQQGRSSDEGV